MVTNPDAIAWSSVTIISLALASVSRVLAHVRSRSNWVVAKALGTVLLLAACVMSPVLVGALVDRLNSTEGVSRVYIDIGAFEAWLPAACAIGTYAVTWASRNRVVRPV